MVTTVEVRVSRMIPQIWVYWKITHFAEIATEGVG